MNSGLKYHIIQDLASTPGFGVNYLVNNFSKTFINLKSITLMVLVEKHMDLI